MKTCERTPAAALRVQFARVIGRIVSASSLSQRQRIRRYLADETLFPRRRRGSSKEWRHGKRNEESVGSNFLPLNVRTPWDLLFEPLRLSDEMEIKMVIIAGVLYIETRRLNDDTRGPSILFISMDIHNFFSGRY